MPSLPEIVFSAVPLWLALALLVPKRDWGTVRARLAATAAGERRHPFGPPLPVRDGVSSRFARRLLAELPRCLELGVPLWLAALAAEYRGCQRRRLAAAAMATSPTGWMWARLLGRISDEELQRRLSEGGYAPPATKAERRFRLPYSMPPMSWLRDLDVGQPEALPSPGAADRHREAGPVSTARLMVQTLGGLWIRLKGEDLTAGLLARPTVSYLWQYLLLQAIQEPERPISRSAVADEVYPGIDPETQHARLRRRLHDLQHKLPALSRPVTITDKDLMLDPRGCDIDIFEILQLAAETAEDGPRRTGLLSDAKVAALEDAIAAAAGEFLPHWVDLEQTVNRGRGQGGDQVRNLRARLIDARVTLLARLGSHQLARREAGRAVVALDEAFRLDPARQGLAEELVKALEAAGHRARAADVRERYVRRE